MTNKKRLLTFLIMAATSTAATANEWTGEGEVGFTSTSGNTDSESLNAKLGIGLEHNKWKHEAELSALKSSDSGVDSADRMEFKEKSQYQFGKKTYAYVALRHEEDEFSGFDHQSMISIGLGYPLIAAEKHKLDGTLGIGYRETETDLGIEEQEAIYNGGLKYKYTISKTAAFNQNVYVESGDSNTYSLSETFLKLVVNGNLSAKMGYEVKHNSDVPAGVDKTDTKTTVTLVYGF